MQRGPSSISVPNLKRIAQFIQKLLGGQKFVNWSRDPGHTHLLVTLYSLCRRGPSSISVPNLKCIAQFVQKLLRGPKIRKVGHDLKRIALFVQKLLGVPNFAPPQTPSRGRGTAKILSAGDGHFLYLQTQFGEDRCTYICNFELSW